MGRVKLSKIIASLITLGTFFVSFFTFSKTAFFLAIPIFDTVFAILRIIPFMTSISLEVNFLPTSYGFFLLISHLIWLLLICIRLKIQWHRVQRNKQLLKKLT